MTAGSLCHLWESRKMGLHYLNLWALIKHSSPSSSHSAIFIIKNLGEYRNSYCNSPATAGLIYSPIAKTAAEQGLGWLAGHH